MICIPRNEPQQRICSKSYLTKQFWTLLHCSGVDESTGIESTSRQPKMSERYFEKSYPKSTSLHCTVDSIAPSFLVVDSIPSRRLDYFDLSTRLLGLVDSISWTRRLDYFDSSTRLLRFVDSITWTRRLDYYDSSTRLLGLIDLITSIRRLGVGYNFLRCRSLIFGRWLVDSIPVDSWTTQYGKSSRWIEVIESKIWSDRAYESK